MTVEAVAAPTDVKLVNFGYLRWVALAFILLATAIVVGNVYALNFIHVLSGALWTGIDIFVGFVLGPTLRQTDIATRRAIALRLMPRMLFLMPSLAIITGTAGYFLARELGFLALPYPEFGWVVAALTVIGLLTLQGLGILLPTNVLTCLELRKERPDPEKLKRLMRIYVRHTGWQGAMQIAIIVVMAKFATGL